jgi:hypothetical protein
MNSPPPPIPRLPSRRVSAVLATAVLGVGIALGALIGPGPAASLASSQRASALARVLALVALGSGASAGSELALSSNNPPTTTPQPTPSTTSEASAGGGATGAGATRASTPASGATRSPSSPPSTSPTSSTTPAGGGEGEGEREKKGKPLPAIANVWLIELPYGTSVENALKQSAAAPYIDGQLKGEGTVLSGYSPLAAAQLAGDAALLSGQVDASVTTLTPPPCGAGASAGATGASGSSPGTAGSGSATAGSGSAAASSPCPSGEPAGLQVANAFLQEAVPKIVASAPYKEHGLIVITFGAVAQQGTQPTGVAPTTAGTGTTGAGGEAGATYPPGSLTSTLTASGAPAGALLLSPFLSHAGARVAGAFNPLAPHESLEGLLRAKPAG